MKIRVGIIFGGVSKEREISFAGGRTVYDNLDKSLFEPVPIFVDSFGKFILLNWEFVYKGSIIIRIDQIIDQYIFNITFKYSEKQVFNRFLTKKTSKFRTLASSYNT